MLTFRYATPADAALITCHRHSMFADNALSSEAVLCACDTEFEPWVRTRLADGRYVGLFLEDHGTVIAGAGIFFADFPPHWMESQPVRAYVLNVYTDPAQRGQGHAKKLMRRVIEDCRRRGVLTIVLHASPQGRPVYADLGFQPTDEMMLRLDVVSAASAEYTAPASAGEDHL